MATLSTSGITSQAKRKQLRRRVRRGIKPVSGKGFGLARAGVKDKAARQQIKRRIRRRRKS